MGRTKEFFTPADLPNPKRYNEQSQEEKHVATEIRTKTLSLLINAYMSIKKNTWIYTPSALTL